MRGQRLSAGSHGRTSSGRGIMIWVSTDYSGGQCGGGFESERLMLSWVLTKRQQG